MQQEKRKRDNLANSLAKAFPKLTPVKGRVVVELLRQFVVTGEPVLPTKIAQALDLQERQVDDILAGWAAWGNVYYGTDHRILAAWGLGVYKTSHRFEVGGRILYTWCALDPFYIVDLLEKAARIESTCPVTGKRISLILEPDGVKGAVPANAVVSVLVPGEPITSDVRLSFCHFVNFFVSAEAGVRWSSKQQGTFDLLSLQDAFSLMRLVNKAYFRGVAGEQPCACAGKVQ